MALQLTPGQTSFARSAARYWIVTPEISWNQVSGLSTLTSGSYVAAEPGSGAATTHFAGLDSAPESSSVYTSFVLHASTVDDVDQGDPVYMRGATIGHVASIDLSDTGDQIELTINIDNASAHYITSKSTFWIDSGVVAEIDTQGINVRTPSVRRMVRGGISIHSPSGAPPAKAGKEFPLLPQRPQDLTPHIRGRRFVLTTSLRGSISVGSPVNYRQVEVGKVTAVYLSPSGDLVEVSIRVPTAHSSLVRENSVFWDVSGIHARAGLFSGIKLDIDSLNAVLNGGIEFATPTAPGPPAAAGTRFALSDKAPEAWPDL